MAELETKVAINGERIASNKDDNSGNKYYADIAGTTLA